MSLLVKEWEIRMELISALTRSQLAMAKMLDSISSQAEVSPATAKSIQENIRILTGLQRTIAENITGVSWARPKRGKLGPVWLSHPRLSAGRPAGAGMQGCAAIGIPAPRSWIAAARSSASGYLAVGINEEE